MKTSAVLIKKVSSPCAKILFLGYSNYESALLGELANKRCEVWHTSHKIDSAADYDLIISYGYKHIINKGIIERSNAPIINLHISYLPWNRGAHPNFWSFYDSTPSGVTIHLIDQGIDTGPILYQRLVNFDSQENTFSKTYKRLLLEIEKLFMDHIDEIISKKFTATPQKSKGSFHTKKDIPKEFSGWDAVIDREIIRLKSIFKKVESEHVFNKSKKDI